MKNAKTRGHLILENTYLKYKNNKLQIENIELQNKLKTLYRNHANSILFMQEKNANSSLELIEKRKNPVFPEK
jgi:hypothetical protein